MVARGRSLIGARNHISKLTEADIPVIRALLKNYGNQVIGDLYGIDRSTIYKIRVGKNWSHVA